MHGFQGLVLPLDDLAGQQHLDIQIGLDPGDAADLGFELEDLVVEVLELVGDDLGGEFGGLGLE